MTDEEKTFWGIEPEEVVEPETKNNIIQGGSYTLQLGNNLELLKTLSDNSIDAVVTDPPY